MNFKILFVCILALLFGAHTHACLKKYLSENKIDMRRKIIIQKFEGIDEEELKQYVCFQARLKSFHVHFKKQFDFIMGILSAKITRSYDEGQLRQYKTNNYTDCLFWPVNYHGRRLFQKAACNKTEYSADIDEKNERSFYDCVVTKNLESDKTLIINYPECNNIDVTYE
ncbi:hypothetical protein COBT_000658 [Conglomerata obtusa]